MGKAKERYDMRIKIALICGVLGATVACGAGSARADSSLKIEKIDTEKGVLQRVTIENSLVKFVFYPDYGARVGEAWYKPANVNVAGQKFDSDGLPDGLGGLLSRDPVSFAFNVLRDTPEAVSIRFFRTDMLRERVVTLRSVRLRTPVEPESVRDVVRCMVVMHRRDVERTIVAVPYVRV